ncbi:MAG: peptidylprolyl isomerase [Planctomycetota bacterium]
MAATDAATEDTTLEDEMSEEMAPTDPVTESIEPTHIRVQHILIGFKDAAGFRGTPPAGAVERSESEARELAQDLLERARAGEDFDALVEEFTDDQAPGIYAMTNTGAADREGHYPRSGMVPAFGNVGFALEVGEIGMSEYDLRTSPYGWHIIKRVE